MNIFFPQWQGSGVGMAIEDGAKTDDECPNVDELTPT